MYDEEAALYEHLTRLPGAQHSVTNSKRAQAHGGRPALCSSNRQTEFALLVQLGPESICVTETTRAVPAGNCPANLGEVA
jgi:hypothetical protein